MSQEKTLDYSTPPQDVSNDALPESRTTMSPEDLLAVKKAVRKIDFAVVPVMTMYYFLSFLDRANIGQLGTSEHRGSFGSDRHYRQCSCCRASGRLGLLGPPIPDYRHRALRASEQKYLDPVDF